MEHSYFIRITPYKTLSYEDIEKILENLDITRWFVCYEEASRGHYHLCIWSLRSVENLRYRLKQEIEGQIYISGKEIEDKIKAIAYCMKDGNYRHKNIDILSIMSAKAVSKKKVTFVDELSNISTEGTPRHILTRIIDLHIKYNRKIYRQHIRALLDLLMCKKDSTYKEELIKNILGEF